MQHIGLEVPKSGFATNMENAYEILEFVGFPAILRPAFTLGGTGGGIAYNREEFTELIMRGLDASPVHQVLIEESVVGWKEYELEVMRDARDNVVIVCSIENLDPMGIHTGDSITVAPAQTLTDKEYQIMRDASLRIIREIGVDTGGSNIQFAVDPKTGRMIVIEMNPRVSRSSALASKATGFPIAKIAAKLAVGYTLDEIRNDITKATPACFEPTIDYVVVKYPRFAFEKFPQADATLTTQMKSVGRPWPSAGPSRNRSRRRCAPSRSTGTGLSPGATATATGSPGSPTSARRSAYRTGSGSGTSPMRSAWACPWTRSSASRRSTPGSCIRSGRSRRWSGSSASRARPFCPMPAGALTTRSGWRRNTASPTAGSPGS